MIRPKSLKIIDENWFNSIVQYEDNYLVFRYYVIYKGKEEDKLREDILNNVFDPYKFPFNYRIHNPSLKYNYNDCIFPENTGKIIYELTCNKIYNLNGKITPVGCSLYSPCKSIWDIPRNTIMGRFSKYITYYLIGKMYLELGLKNFRFYIDKINKYTKNEFIYDYFLDEKIIYLSMHWFQNIKIHLDKNKLENFINKMERDIIDERYIEKDIRDFIHKYVLQTI